MNTTKLTEDFIFEIIKENPNIVRIDGFDDSIIGVCDTYRGVIFLYSEAKIIDKLSKSMNRSEANRYYEEEILGAYIGEYAPAILRLLTVKKFESPYYQKYEA